MSKKKENVEEKKIYPSVVLGLDISAACVGISIVRDDGVNKPIVELITHIVPKVSKKIKGIEALILRKDIFEKDFLTKYKNYGITECVIESPLIYATGNSNAQTVSQLLQFNGLLSEAVYRVLNIIPNYVSSSDARMLSFPNLMSIRKFNKKGETYKLSHIKKNIKDSHLILFGSYPFDCDKKSVMMDMVSETYPDINWIVDDKGNIRKENYDACDSLVCALAYINKKKYGDINFVISDSRFDENNDGTNITYYIKFWDKILEKKLFLPST